MTCGNTFVRILTPVAREKESSADLDFSIGKIIILATGHVKGQIYVHLP
jgi:hypothetical protein